MHTQTCRHKRADTEMGVMKWTYEAEQALREVPFFVRPAVRRKIEALATDHKQQLIDEAFYKEARAKFSRRSP